MLGRAFFGCFATCPMEPCPAMPCVFFLVCSFQTVKTVREAETVISERAKSQDPGRSGSGRLAQSRTLCLVAIAGGQLPQHSNR